MAYILIFVLLWSFLGALIGLWKGIRKTVSSIIAVILAGITSMLISPPIVKLFFTQDNLFKIVDVLEMTETYNELVAASPAIEELLLALPVTLIAPLVFLIFFFILRIIFRIIAGFVSKIFFPKKEKMPMKLIGMPLGLVRGFMTAMVIMVVLGGLINTVDDITDVIIEQESEQLADIKETVEDVEPYLSIVTDDPIIKMLDSTNFVYDHLTSFDFKDEKVVFGEEMVSIVEAGIYIMPIAKNTEISQWSEKEFELLDGFVARFGDSRILTEVSAELLSSACEKWANGEAFMGITPPTVDEMIDPLVISLFNSFKDSTAETVVEDMSTFVDVLQVIDKYEILTKMQGESVDVMSLLSGDFISDFLTVISGNERFSALIPEISNLSMRMLASALELPENAEAVYGNVTENICQDLNVVLQSEMTEDDMNSFTDSLKGTLKENGITISDDVVNIVSENIVTAFESKESVTADDIKGYFEDYAAIYTAVEGAPQNSAAVDGSIKLSSNTSAVASPTFIDFVNMTHDEKLSALSSVGIIDYCKLSGDISNPENVLNNGMTAEDYVDYIIVIYNSIISNYDAISSLGNSETNVLISLKSPETMISTAVTMSDLVIDNVDYVLTEAEITNIANGFEKINEFIQSYTELEGSLSIDNIGNLNLPAAGEALDHLKDTQIFGDNIGVVADSLIGKVTGSSINISEKVESGETSYGSLMETVQSTTEVIANMSKEEVTEEEKEEAIVDLLLNLTEENSSIIAEIVTEDFIKAQGVPDEYAKVSVSILRTALIEMAKLPEDQHDKEAAQIKYLFDIVSSGNEDALIGENGIFQDSNDVIDMVVNSKVASATLKTILVDENGNKVVDPLGLASSLSKDDKADLESSIVEYYDDNKSGMSAEELAELEENLNAIVLLCNLDINIG